MTNKIVGARSSLLYSLALVGNHEYLDDMSSIFAESIRFYGVKHPVLRATMQKWLDQSELNFEERRKIVQTLWDGGSREERLIALWMVSEEEDLLKAVTWNEILIWSGSPDNWEVADVLAMRILAPWILRDLVGRLKYLDLLLSGNSYWRRSVSISAAISLNHLGSVTYEHTIHMIERILPEHHPVVTRVVLLALLELIKINPMRLSLFLRQHREELPAHLLAEVEKESLRG